MERIAVVDGLTLAAVLSRVEAGGRVILTKGGAVVAVIVRPDDLTNAATAYLLEEWARLYPSDLAVLEAAACPTCGGPHAAPHPVTPNGRPQSPPAGVS